LQQLRAFANIRLLPTTSVQKDAEQQLLQQKIVACQQALMQ
jgi:hypothetical protein